jgi:Dolichyl-phosphate-mannose-protein mannosyltransferase
MDPARKSFCNRLTARPLTTVFVFALAVRLINIALLKGDASFFAETDTLVYWLIGTELTKPDAFWPTLLSMTYRMPLYPLLLAGIKGAFGEVPRAVAATQAVIDAGTCTMIAALGALLSPRVGLVAGILAALSVTLIVFSSQMVTDTLFLFFFTLMLLAGARFLLRPGNGLALFAGIAGGLSLATRPAVALLLVAALPVVFVVALRRRGFAPALIAVALYAIAAAAPIAPIWLRNVVHYGSFQLMSQTGDHLALWIVPLVTQRADGTPYRTTIERMEVLYRQRLAERGLDENSNPFQRDAVKSEVAREAMRSLPFAAYAKAWVEGMAVNLAAPALLDDPRVRALPKPSFYNTPGTTLWERARTYLFDDPGRYQVLLLAGLAAMIPILLLAAVGFVMLARMSPWAATFAAGVLAYFLLVNGPVASPKYRLPIEPVLIVLAALPLAWLLDRRRLQPEPHAGVREHPCAGLQG